MRLVHIEIRMAMTQIFIFNNASRAAHYGIGTYVRQLAEGLRECPDTTVSFVDFFADVKEYTVSDDACGCRHYRIPSGPSGGEDENSQRCAFYFLARHIRMPEGSRLVFQFNYFQHHLLASLLKGRYADSRIALTVHYLSWCFELKGNLESFRRMTAKDYEPQDDKERQVAESVKGEKAFLHLADEVIVLSRFTQTFLTEDYGIPVGKMHLVYNGLGEGLRPENGKETGVSRMILFVGRLDEIKGLDRLIDAFVRISGKHSDARLVVVGDGNFQPYLAQSRPLQGRVSFLGRMNGEELEDIYRSAFIGVMPSFHEQCSYTAIEMMRHGIPIIGTDSTGLAEMLDATPELRVHIEGQDGDGLSGQIASRLDFLLSDAEAYGRASAAVARLYEVRYQLPTMIAGTCGVWEASFGKPGHAVADDYLEYMDAHMVQLVNQSPDIDLDFYGMGGIGLYLWMRVAGLWDKEKEEETFHLSFLQEHLIYYLDWLAESARGVPLPGEILTMLRDMECHGFYKSLVSALLGRQPAPETSPCMPPKKDIIQNALKICNSKI